MKTIKKFTINASAEKVWKVFAHDFDNAHKWLASIPISYGENLGKGFEGATSSGRVCAFGNDENGIKAYEKFTAYDEAAKTCTVEVEMRNAPMVFPIKQNILSFEVKDIGNKKSEVSWTVNSKLSFFGLLIYPLFRAGFNMAMGQIGEELAVYVETGIPHERKLKNLKKLEALKAL